MDWINDWIKMLIKIYKRLDKFFLKIEIFSNVMGATLAPPQPTMYSMLERLHVDRPCAVRKDSGQSRIFMKMSLKAVSVGVPPSPRTAYNNRTLTVILVFEQIGEKPWSHFGNFLKFYNFQIEFF